MSNPQPTQNPRPVTAFILAAIFTALAILWLLVPTHDHTILHFIPAAAWLLLGITWFIRAINTHRANTNTNPKN